MPERLIVLRGVSVFSDRIDCNDRVSVGAARYRQRGSTLSPDYFGPKLTISLKHIARDPLILLMISLRREFECVKITI